MAHKLADELLKEILSPPLLVPDELFANTGAVSPFSRATYSAADVLLVCKRWMRVATPALYSTVIIRSLAQAQALAVALSRNPDFGRYIKKLRLEGAYGVNLAKIGLVSPNISDLCFSLSIWADASNSGLLKLLSAVNPKRVVLTTAPAKIVKNKQLAEVVKKLCDRIPLWTKLETFYFSSSLTRVRRWESSTEFELYPDIAKALALSTSLRAVHMWACHWGSARAIEALSALASSSTIASFHLHSSYDCDRSGEAAILGLIPATIRSRAIVVVPETHTAATIDTSRVTREAEPADYNPFYIPMANAPESLRLQIWALIFDLALQKQKSSWTPGHSKVWYDTDRVDSRTARSLMLASRSFSATVIPLLCRHLAISSETSMLTLLGYMATHAIPGSMVHSLNVRLLPVNVTPLLARTTHLRECTVPADPDVLEALGRVAGTTLQELAVVSTFSKPRPFSAALLFPFTCVTHLRWAVYRIALEPVRADACPPDALGKLRMISLRTSESEVCTALEPFELPSVTEITSSADCAIGAGFLQRHGHKLKLVRASGTRGLDPSLCSSLETFEHTALMGQDLAVPFPQGHASLRQLKLNWVPILRGRQAELTPWALLFRTLTRTQFPALREVQLTYNMDIWPTSERDIKKSPWPGYAEALTAEGIALLDHTGRAWRPRLSTKR